MVVTLSQLERVVTVGVGDDRWRFRGSGRQVCVVNIPRLDVRISEDFTTLLWAECIFLNLATLHSIYSEHLTIDKLIEYW